MIRTALKIDLGKLKTWLDELESRWPTPEETCSPECRDDYYQKFFKDSSTVKGWHLQEAHERRNKPFRRSKPDPEDFDSRNYRFPSRYLFGYAEEILSGFVESFRANIYQLMPDAKWNWHTDSKGTYRMVVAIKTNPGCFFQYQEEARMHIPADGHVYILFTEKVHCAGNLGNSSRTHLIWSMPNSTLEKYLTP